MLRSGSGCFQKSAQMMRVVAAVLKPSVLSSLARGRRSFWGAVEGHFGESLYMSGLEFTDEYPFATLQIWQEHQIRHYNANVSSMQIHSCDRR